MNETTLLGHHNLSDDQTANVLYGQCEITLTSNRSGIVTTVSKTDCLGGYEYAEGHLISMVAEWNLVCGKSVIVSLVQTMFTVGLAVGVILFTSLADRFGRKYVYMFDAAATILIELGMVFAPNVYAAIALRFFAGFTSAGMCLLHCIIAAELVKNKYRQVFYAVDCMWWSVNVMILAGIAFALRNHSWRYLQLASPLIGIPTLLTSFIVNETPIWYFAKGRYEDARRILRKAARMNNKNVDCVMDLFQDCIREAKQSSAVSNQNEEAISNNYTLLDIIRNRYIFMLIIISAFIWFTNSLAYYGLYLTSSSIAGNRFLNFFLMALLEIPSCLFSILMVSYFGRRVVIFIFMALSAVCLLISTILVALDFSNEHVANASTAFFLMGKFAVGASFNITAAFTPEYLVTTIRSVGTGICTMFCRVGTGISPFLIPLFEAVNWAPGAILTSLCFISLLLIPILPETKGRQLPNSIEEIMQWKRKEKNGFKSGQEENKDIAI